MTIDALMVWCRGCQALWDMDRDPGQCTCDGDVDDDQDLFVVAVRENGPLWLSTVDVDGSKIFANGNSVDDAIERLLPLLKAAILKP